MSINPAIVTSSGIAITTCNATDQNNDSLSYTWTVSGGKIVAIAGSNTATFTAPVEKGTIRITCKVSDAQAEDNAQIDVVVQEWVIPTQFASSLSNCDMVADGAVFNGKLYLGWMVVQ